MKKRLRRYVEYLSEHDIELLDASMTGSCHYKLSVTSRGSRRFFIAPFSPSDRRGFENWKSDVRKWLREISPS